MLPEFGLVEIGKYEHIIFEKTKLEKGLKKKFMNKFF